MNRISDLIVLQRWCSHTTSGIPGSANKANCASKLLLPDAGIPSYTRLVGNHSRKPKLTSPHAVPHIANPPLMCA